MICHRNLRWWENGFENIRELSNSLLNKDENVTEITKEEEVTKDRGSNLTQKLCADNLNEK